MAAAPVIELYRWLLSAWNARDADATFASLAPMGPSSSRLRGWFHPGGSDLDPSKNAVRTLMAQRDAGRWQIASFQNTPAAFHGRPELGQRLTDELRQVLHVGAR